MASELVIADELRCEDVELHVSTYVYMMLDWPENIGEQSLEQNVIRLLRRSTDMIVAITGKVTDGEMGTGRLRAVTLPGRTL